MTTLVTLGCSHTHGSMIDGYNGTSQYNIDHAFPAIIAKKHGFGYVNMSTPGGSNSMIQRWLATFINNNMVKGGKYIFLINWTSPMRTELRYTDASPHTHETFGDYKDKKYVPFTPGTNPTLYHTKEIRKLSSYCHLLFDEEHYNTDWAVHAYTVQQMLKGLNMPYFMLNTCHEMYTNPVNTQIAKALDTKYYHCPFDEKESFVYWALENKFEKTPCWHFREDAHLAWADYIDNKIEEAGLYDN